jgi:hypothetical protein
MQLSYVFTLTLPFSPLLSLTLNILEILPLAITVKDTPTISTNGTISFSLGITEIVEMDPQGGVAQNYSLQTDNITLTCILSSLSSRFRSQEKRENQSLPLFYIYFF